MNEENRYSCQISLPGFDEAAQQKLSNAKVLIVGAGGLGCPAAQYLVSSGVGTVTIADYDTVSIKNLHRQILYTPADVGQKKVTVAQQKLQTQNPEINVVALDIAINSANVMNTISNYDIVVDCSDNFDTRYLLNDACVLSGKPLVYGAIYQYEGQVAIWNVTNENGTQSPNYRDVYPNVNAAAVPNCADGGVIPTIAGVIGCMQANEVIKYLTGIDDLLAGKLLIFDAQTMHSRVMKLSASTKTNITSLPTTAQVKGITGGNIQASILDYYLIDVRTAEEHLEFNIGGKNIPLNEISNVVVDTDRPIVCYCASGKRSAEAVRILMGKYPNHETYSLQGGLNAYPIHQG